MRMKGRKVFVTGGSSGIGLSIVEGFLNEGAQVAFTYRTNRSLERPEVRKLMAEFKSLYPVCTDLSQQINASELVQEVAECFQASPDVLVNNAAAFSRDKLIDTEREKLLEILEVNLIAPFMLISAFSQALISAGKGGSIINISSLSANMARSEMSAYQCSKAGLEMLSNSAAYELAQYNIRSNIIAPGLTDTPANVNQRVHQPDLWKKRASTIPLKRTGRPEDYIGAAIYFASDDSKWVTGAKVVVDGGMSTF